MSQRGELVIMTGPTCEQLATEVAEQLEVEALRPCREFRNGDVGCDIPTSVRGSDVFVFESHCAREEEAGGQPERYVRHSPQDAFMSHVLAINAARRAWAGRVIAVAPFMGYGRQDRLTGRQSITASLAFRLMKEAGADGVVSIDMHTPQAEGFFSGPVEHLTATPSLARHVQTMYPDGEVVMVSPDNGRLKHVARFCKLLGNRASLAVIDKERNADGSASAMRIMGASVEGLPCIISDDMLDGGGTAVAAARLLKELGASKTVVMVTHPLCTYPASERLASSDIDALVGTNTVPLPISVQKLMRPQIQTVSIAGFLAKAIRRIHNNESVSELHAGIDQRI